MKAVHVHPGAKRLIQSLRGMGYECSTAIADLVDNSIAAQATEITVDFLPRQGNRPAAVVIADNGNGMSEDELIEAMRFGSLQEYTSDDLGKFGLGLKTASLSQCRVLTVASKAKKTNNTRPRRHYVRWDIDHVYKTNDWNLLVPNENELPEWEKEILDNYGTEENGTVILWTGLQEALPDLSASDANRREKFLAELIDKVGAHLRMVFHLFMQGSIIGTRKLTINLCGKDLVPWDPFSRNESTQELKPLKLPIILTEPDGSEIEEVVTISPYILPHKDEFSSQAAWEETSGPKKWNHQQGLYFYRNNRLLQAGGWSYLRAPDEHTKLLRVAVHFSTFLDPAFQINITKMRALIPSEIRDELKNHIKEWAKLAERRYRGIKQPEKKKREIEAPAPSKEKIEIKEEKQTVVNIGPLIFSALDDSNASLTFIKELSKNQLNIQVPPNHELSEIFETDKGGTSEIKHLCKTLLYILEAVGEKRISAQGIPIKHLKRILRYYS